MERLKDRKTAAIVMIIVMAAAFFLGGGRQLASQRAQAEAILVDGDYGDGRGIDFDLGTRINTAYNLKTVAERNLDPSQKGLIEAMLAARESLVDAKTPSEKAEANRRLSETAREVYSALEAAVDGESEEGGRARRLWADLVSAEDRISRSGYNSAARAFNELRGRLPASLIAAWMRIKPLELFS